mmetsp:Transcript_9509/g.14569  ORF Transcript_9509/g.14569 Transcript_9509/m.14569 type:complete len:83 (-) Transcript_9509:863-1111(-)
MDLELGIEVLIPEEHAMHNLPLSFQYYDSIIVLAQKRISSDRMHFLKLKKKLHEMFEQKLSLRETLGYGKVLKKLKNKKKKI